MDSSDLIKLSGPVFLARRLSDGSMVEIGPDYPLSVTGADRASGNFSASKITNDGTAGVWTELLAADATRLSAAIQNMNASADLYIVESATQPSSGSADGELNIPPSPAYYEWPFSPTGRWWVRSTVVSSVATVWSW